MIMLLIIIISKLHIMNTDCIGDVGDGGKDFISIQKIVIRVNDFQKWYLAVP